ncbi:hypothetical protein V8F06_013767 [Rhypophila decipiens]
MVGKRLRWRQGRHLLKQQREKTGPRLRRQRDKSFKILRQWEQDEYCSRATTVNCDKSLMVEVKLQDYKGQEITAVALIDSGSTIDLISPRLVNRARLSWQQKKQPYVMRTYEGNIATYDGGRSQRESTLLITVIEKRLFYCEPQGKSCNSSINLGMQVKLLVWK